MKNRSLYKQMNSPKILATGIDQEQFRSMRQELGWSQEKMADEIGLSRRHIIYIEKGGKLLKKYQLAAVLLYLIHKNNRA